jgi:hypothetical protein
MGIAAGDTAMEQRILRRIGVMTAFVTRGISAWPNHRSARAASPRLSTIRSWIVVKAAI